LNAPLDFSHENEQLFGDSDGRIVDLRFQRVRGASVILPKQTFSTRSHHYDHHRSGQARLGADNASRIEMNILVTYRVMAFMAVIEQAGLPALRVAFTIAVTVFLFGDYAIFPSSLPRRFSSVVISLFALVSINSLRRRFHSMSRLERFAAGC
jgi:hypothetical protein